MSRTGVIYRVHENTIEAFERKASLPEFYEVMGDHMDAATPHLTLNDAMRTWDWLLRDIDGPLGALFEGDFRATSENSDPWVIVHGPARVAQLARAWRAAPLGAFRDALNESYPAHLDVLDFHGPIGDFLTEAARTGSGLILLYET